MNLEGSRTKTALEAAFQIEAAAAVRYFLYARKAKEEGQLQLANLFTHIAQKEIAHGEIWLSHLGEIKSTKENLQAAWKEEDKLLTTTYVQMAQVAQSEGFLDLAKQFVEIARIEGHHRELLAHYLEEPVQEAVYYLCENCGHLHFSTPPLANCPVCAFPASTFVAYTERY